MRFEPDNEDYHHKKKKFPRPGVNMAVAAISMNDLIAKYALLREAEIKNELLQEAKEQEKRYLKLKSKRKLGNSIYWAVNPEGKILK